MINKIYTINLGRELGSGGRLIAEKVAEQLSIKFYDKALLRLASEQSGLSSEYFEKADENTSKWRIADIVDFFRSQNNILGEESLFKINSEIIQELAAKESSLFVGRCADYILRENPRTVNIFVTANREDRVERVKNLKGISAEQAARKIKEGDAARSAYYNYYTTKVWGKASSYDLCVNSSCLGIEGTVDFIVSYVRGLLK